MAEESRKTAYGRRDYDQIPVRDRVTCKFCHKIVHKNSKACPYCSQFYSFWDEIRRPAIYIAFLTCGLAYLSLYVTLKTTKGETDALFSAAQSNGTKEDAKAAGGSPLSGKYSFENIGPQKEQELLQRNFENAPKNVVEVIKDAFALKNDGNIWFKWGGKSPEEGFDSSGFVAYVLSKNGFLDSVGYRLYNTTRLKTTFLNIPLDQIQAGDLVMYKSGFVSFYLGEKRGIGIGNSKGIQVVNLDMSKVDAILRWNAPSGK